MDGDEKGRVGVTCAAEKGTGHIRSGMCGRVPARHPKLFRKSATICGAVFHQSRSTFATGTVPRCVPIAIVCDSVSFSSI